MVEYMPYIWLGLAVFLGIIEVCTAQLVSIWFVIGAVLTSICAATFLSDNLIWQIVVFLVASVICLLFTRPIVRKIKSADKTKTNSDRYVGKVGLVTTEINWQTSSGQVEVEGSRWSARSSDNSIIKAGTTVLVEKIQGVKLIVTPVDVNEKE